MIYLKSEVADDAYEVSSGSNGTVEHIMVYSRRYNLAIANVYRPPGTTTELFSPVIQELQERYLELSNLAPSLVIYGDFNLPGTCWPVGSPEYHKAAPDMINVQ